MTDTHVRRSIRSRGLVVALGALLAMLLPSLTLVGPPAHADPGPETIQASLTGDDVEGFDWPSGDTVDVEIPAGTQPGKVFTVRGKGMTALGRRTRGDLLVIVELVVPTDLTTEEEGLLRRWSEMRGERTDRPASA